VLETKHVYSRTNYFSATSPRAGLMRNGGGIFGKGKRFLFSRKRPNLLMVQHSNTTKYVTMCLSLVEKQQGQ
jgi:hypothetical protein